MAESREKILEQEIQRLKDYIFHLKLQNQNLEKILSSITSARAFRIWQSYTAIRKRFYTFLGQSKDLVPLPLRKSLKSHLQELNSTTPENFTIDSDIQRDLDIYSDTRKVGSLDIFIFSIIAFNYRIQRPQHLALELAKRGHRVFYIENDFVTYSGSGSHEEVPVKILKQAENVYRVSLYASKDIFIYRDKPSDKDITIMLKTLKYIFLKARVQNTVAKLDHPFWAHLSKEISMPYLYDCMDEHVGFKETGTTMHDLEKALYRESGAVLVSSDYLYQKALTHSPKKLVVIKNAGEYSHFSTSAHKDYPVPWEIDRIKRPVIGYYGAISDWFDAELLEQIARCYPQSSIVLIGRVENSEVRTLAKKYKNIFLLGEKLYDELPSYLQEFDVCIIPFIVNHLIKATSPVKVYEYMASGKPVVTTDIPELHEYENCIYVSKGHEVFLKNLNRALSEKKDGKREQRIAVAKQNTWADRAEALLKIVSTLVFPKVSIITAVFNRKDDTKECVESILIKSAYPNFELIIVDNNSQSETAQMLKTYADNPQVKLIINKKNHGFSGGYNAGLRVARGDYIVIINNDTVVSPGWLSRLVFHASKKEIGLVGPITNHIGNEQQIVLSNESEYIRQTYEHWGEELKLRNLAAFCWILRREVYKIIGGFDEKYGKALFEDDDYCMSIKKIGLSLVCADDVVVFHKGSATVGSDQTDEYRKLFEKNKKYFEEKWGVTWVPHKYR